MPAVLAGGLGLWTLFRTRHLLVIGASLAAIFTLLLYWFYVIDPMLGL
jgi:hypothetical protein